MKNNHYDVGIVGFWYGINYGSVLTYYALYKTIENLDKRPILINKPLNLWNDKFYKKDTLANRFFAKKCKTSRIRKSDSDWEDMNNFCDTFVVGSDVVWKSSLPSRCGYHFFLDFVDSTKNKIAYAPSFGGEWEANEKITKFASYFLHKFDAISCREFEGVEICKNIFEVHAEQVLDPVFLLDPNAYELLAETSTRKREDKFITAYILGPGATKRKMLLKLQELMGNIELVNIVNAGNETKGKELLKLDTEENMSVEDWLYYIKNCDLYIGDSFHGICFSIIFRKKFILIRNRVSPSRCRFDSLLRICGLENRSIYADEDISLRKDLLEDIDYSAVYSKLNVEVEKSRKWLSNALEGRKEKRCTEYDVLIDKINKINEDNLLLKNEIEKLKIALMNQQ